MVGLGVCGFGYVDASRLCSLFTSDKWTVLTSLPSLNSLTPCIIVSCSRSTAFKTSSSSFALHSPPLGELTSLLLSLFFFSTSSHLSPPSRSNELTSFLSSATSRMGGATFLRSLVAFALPLVGALVFERLGWGGGGSLLAGLSILALPAPTVMLIYGARLRECIRPVELRDRIFPSLPSFLFCWFLPSRAVCLPFAHSLYQHSTVCLAGFARRALAWWVTSSRRVQVENEPLLLRRPSAATVCWTIVHEYLREDYSPTEGYRLQLPDGYSR